MELTVAVTGASGSIYARRTLMHMASSGAVERVNLIMSASALTVARVETGAKIEAGDARAVNEWVGLAADSRLIQFHRLDNMAAKPSSGSHPQAGMVVVPCSMGTLGAIASGAGTNLIHRAADVTLKERRKLVLLVRESPFSDIHLENMLKLSRMGAVVVPPVPAFYNRPQTIDDIVNHIVQRALDQLGIHLDVASRWDGVMRAGEQRKS
jgi:4-hydroxy-3-polyprenylbenzoate decarboxylase